MYVCIQKYPNFFSGIIPLAFYVIIEKKQKLNLGKNRKVEITMLKKFFAFVLSLTTLFSFGERSFANEDNSTVLDEKKDEKSYALCECTEALTPDEILLKLTPDAISKMRVSEIIPGMRKIFFEPAEQLEREIADFKKANKITFGKSIRTVIEAVLSTSIGGALGYLATSIYEKFKTKPKVEENKDKSTVKNGKITKKDITILSAVGCLLGFIVKYCTFRNKKATEFKKLLDDLKVENIKRSIGLGGFRCIFKEDHSELPQNANKKHLLSKLKKNLEKIILEEEEKEDNQHQELIENWNFYDSIKLF